MEEKRGKYHHYAPADINVFPSSKDFDLEDIATDSSIMYWDDALTSTDCDQIIAKFEANPKDQYDGVCGANQQVNPVFKKNTEVHISEEANFGRQAFRWFLVDKLLQSATIKYLGLYQESNIIIATQTNPFNDEGFRMKRYKPDGTSFSGNLVYRSSA